MCNVSTHIGQLRISIFDAPEHRVERIDGLFQFDWHFLWFQAHVQLGRCNGSNFFVSPPDRHVPPADCGPGHKGRNTHDYTDRPPLHARKTFSKREVLLEIHSNGYRVLRAQIVSTASTKDSAAIVLPVLLPYRHVLPTCEADRALTRGKANQVGSIGGCGKRFACSGGNVILDWRMCVDSALKKRKSVV